MCGCLLHWEFGKTVGLAIFPRYGEFFSYPAFTPRLFDDGTIIIFAKASPVADVRWFFRGPEDGRAIAQRLKQMACPHCKVVGALIRHGFLYGFDETSPQRETKRAQRIFCSNRNARPGCGRTFSIWLVDKIRRLSLTTGALWQFLQLVIAGNIVAASLAVKARLSERTWQRIWKRFKLAQSKIRTALCAYCPPPESLPRSPPCRPARLPAQQVLAHLQSAFPDVPCPIAAFQLATHTFFM